MFVFHYLIRILPLVFLISAPLICMPAPDGFEEVKGQRFNIMAAGSKDFVYGIDNAKNVKCLKKGKWVQIPGKMEDIAAGSDGTVYALGGNHAMGGWEVFKLMNNTVDSPEGEGWQIIKKIRLTDIDIVKKGIVWGVKGAQKACRLVNESTNEWEDISGVNLFKIAAADDATVFALQGENTAIDMQLLHRLGTSLQTLSGSDWEKWVGKFIDVAVGSASNIWVITKERKLLRWGGSNWEPITEGIQKVTVASDGTVYLLGGEQGEGGWQVFKLVKLPTIPSSPMPLILAPVEQTSMQAVQQLPVPERASTTPNITVITGQAGMQPNQSLIQGPLSQPVMQPQGPVVQGPIIVPNSQVVGQPPMPSQMEMQPQPAPSQISGQLPMTVGGISVLGGQAPTLNQVGGNVSQVAAGQPPQVQGASVTPPSETANTAGSAPLITVVPQAEKTENQLPQGEVKQAPSETMSTAPQSSDTPQVEVKPQENSMTPPMNEQPTSGN